MPVDVKICGLKTPGALGAALDAGADLVGFVFFPPSPRNVGIEAARRLGAQVEGRAKKVALSVDATDVELAQAIEALKPDLLQLHGKETPERVAVVRSRFGLPVMKALPIEQKADLAPIRVLAARSTGICWRVSACRFRSCCPAASTRATWPRRCASPVRPASMFRPASSARRARRIRR
jgi:phosphoribosylanthranilate isomerase